MKTPVPRLHLRVCDESRPDTFVGTPPPPPTSPLFRVWVHRSWIAILSIALVASILSLLGYGAYGCGPGPGPTPPAPTVTPTVTPTTPPTTSPTFDNLHLTVSADGERFIRVSDPSYRTRKCISCCRDTIGTGWPGLSSSWISSSYNQGQCNLYHWRVGPFRSCNEPEWKVTNGGAYVEDPITGKVDLTQFNQPYFDALRAAAIQIGLQGGNLEVSLADGWGCKTVSWQSNGASPCVHPWHPAGNIQGQDHLTGMYRGVLDPIHTAYVNKIYATLRDLHNVIYEAGTETDQLLQTGRTGQQIVTFELTMEALLRQDEAAHGITLSHLFGSNYVGDASKAWLRNNRLQYQNSHRLDSAFPRVAKSFWDPDPHRPLVYDEYNESPAAKPEAIRARACYCRKYGCIFAAWRGDQTQNQWLATLSLLSQDAQSCPTDLEDGCPYPVSPVARVDCKVHGYPIMDCTPKTGSGQPILQEGDTARALCEQSAAGMEPWDGVQWSVSDVVGGTVRTEPRANRWQFTLSGTKGATAILHCKLPNVPDACHGFRVTVQ